VDNDNNLKDDQQQDYDDLEEEDRDIMSAFSNSQFIFSLPEL
jgi:hypothetical protein